MLSRVFIDNYRTFVNFECRFGRKQLLLGGNGSGKTSLLQVIYALRQLIANDGSIAPLFRFNRTRWLSQAEQVFELDATLAGGVYTYRLVISPEGQKETTVVREEWLKLDGQLLFAFNSGEVQLFNDSFERTVAYPFDWSRSALGTISGRKDNQLLMSFKNWAGKAFCFHLQPGLMEGKAETESLGPNATLDNFANWYRHVAQTDPIQTSRLFASLSEALPGFRRLIPEPAGERERLLVSEFDSPFGTRQRYAFGELSDGQRCLICLYAIAHILLTDGATVILDEPDNYVSLREIQPWLNLAEDMLERPNGGQLLLISHHPELLNQWAPSYGLRFVRDGAGPSLVKRFEGNDESPLTPAELIARGWEDE